MASLRSQVQIPLRTMISAAVLIFSGMGSMYWSDWFRGRENRFYGIGDFECIACGGGGEREEEESGKD